MDGQERDGGVARVTRGLGEARGPHWRATCLQLARARGVISAFPLEGQLGRREPVEELRVFTPTLTAMFGERRPLEALLTLSPPPPYPFVQQGSPTFPTASSSLRRTSSGCVTRCVLPPRPRIEVKLTRSHLSGSGSSHRGVECPAGQVPGDGLR
jgi:hypothetical protein